MPRPTRARGAPGPHTPPPPRRGWRPRDAVAALHGSGEASATADVVAQVVALTEQLRELRLQL
jgi:hypothetical protein